MVLNSGDGEVLSRLFEVMVLGCFLGFEIGGEKGELCFMVIPLPGVGGGDVISNDGKTDT